MANKYIKKGSTIHTDESPAYDNLIYFHDLKHFSHQQEYRSDEDVTNNLTKSFFSRFKCMYYAQVHKMDNLYLHEYANEIANRAAALDNPHEKGLKATAKQIKSTRMTLNTLIADNMVIKSGSSRGAIRYDWADCKNKD